MSDDGMEVLLWALMVILPVSALLARRLPLGETMKMALAWVAIFGVLFVVVALWQSAMGAGSILGGIFQ